MNSGFLELLARGPAEPFGLGRPLRGFRATVLGVSPLRVYSEGGVDVPASLIEGYTPVAGHSVFVLSTGHEHFVIGRLV